MKGFQLNKIVWHALPVVGLILWGVLALNNGLWYDEAYSAALVRQDLDGLIAITGNDVHSPFYYIMLKGFYHLCGGGNNYWSLKIFSLIFAFGYLLVGKYWIKRLYDEKTSVYFMAFSVLMPIMMYHATNARMYFCGIFFFTVTALLALELYRGEDNGSLLQWVFFGISSICSVYCHTYQMIETLLLYMFFFVGILYKKQYKKLIGFFAAGVAVIVGFVPWLGVTYNQLMNRVGDTTDATAQLADLESRMNILPTYAKEWFSTSETPLPLVMYLGMGLFLWLGYYAVNRMREKREYAAAIGVAIIAVTACVGTYMNCNVAPSFMGRYVIFGFGAVALLYAQGMQQMTSKGMKLVVWVLAVCCFFMQYREELALDYNTELGCYEEFLENTVQEHDVIMASSIHTMMLSVYDADREYMIYGHLPGENPFPVQETFTQWEQLEDILGTLWFIGNDPGLLGERYTYEEAIRFHHMYYDFSVYKMIPKEIQ
ncbi:MAG: hypothetical protein IJ327_02535 [Lachnospiraceae bacterium]|nr:hypothetical protein [Lachnospiraceae bacterium]